MSVLGVGIDVCDIARFGLSLDRTPGLRERLFTPAEYDALPGLAVQIMANGRKFFLAQDTVAGQRRRCPSTDGVPSPSKPPAPRPQASWATWRRPRTRSAA